MSKREPKVARAVLAINGYQLPVTQGFPCGGRFISKREEQNTMTDFSKAPQAVKNLTAEAHLTAKVPRHERNLGVLMSWRLKNLIACGVILLLLTVPPVMAAPPACNAAAEGTIVYNKDHKLVQFCNGAQWIGMVAKISGGGEEVTAWVTYDGAAQTILDSYNVASVTRHSAGNYTIHFETPMDSAHYAASLLETNYSNGFRTYIIHGSDATATSFKVHYANTSGTYADQRITAIFVGGRNTGSP